MPHLAPARRPLEVDQNGRGMRKQLNAVVDWARKQPCYSPRGPACDSNRPTVIIEYKYRDESLVTSFEEEPRRPEMNYVPGVFANFGSAEAVEELWEASESQKQENFKLPHKIIARWTEQVLPIARLRRWAHFPNDPCRHQPFPAATNLEGPTQSSEKCRDGAP